MQKEPYTNTKVGLTKNTSSYKETPKLSVPQETINQVLTYLQSFEHNKEYLDSKLSINSLAQTIGTNPTYLSKIINHYKGKSFPQYINALRIDSCVSTLRQEPLYQKYTIPAIASQFGFNTAESFGKAFSLNTGVKPSFFIKNVASMASL